MKENKQQLEELIETWELELNSQKSLTEDNVLELSSHLRDHVDELLERNLTEEEAFAIARYQVGEVREIEEEFKKVNNNDTSLYRKMIFGVLSYGLVSSFVTVLINTSSFVLIEMGFKGSSFYYLNTLSWIIMMLFLVLTGYRIVKEKWLIEKFKKGETLIWLGVLTFFFMILDYAAIIVISMKAIEALSGEYHSLYFLNQRIFFILFKVILIIGVIYLGIKKRKKDQLPTEFV